VVSDYGGSAVPQSSCEIIFDASVADIIVEVVVAVSLAVAMKRANGKSFHRGSTVSPDEAEHSERRHDLVLKFPVAYQYFIYSHNTLFSSKIRATIFPHRAE
jgi:methyl coenzyme M reductase subunit C